MYSVARTGKSSIHSRFFPDPAYFQFSLIWLSVMLIARLIELSLFIWKSGWPDTGFSLIFSSLFNDLRFLFTTLLLLYPLYWLLWHIAEGLARWVVTGIFVALTLMHIGLVYYYSKTSVLLGADLFGYSLADIRQTVGASGGFSFPVLLLVMVLTAGLTAALWRLRHRIRPNQRWLPGLLLPGLLFLLLPAGNTIFRPGSEQLDNLSANKSGYFSTAAYTYLTASEADYETDIYALADEPVGDASAQLAQITYSQEDQFPFLHTESTPDVLGPFFRPASTKPSIVVIIAEGLSQAFSGDEAPLGSFTPFLDSLADRSLHWNHFLSEGGRTFAVLPSILGSLPFAKNGFSELGPAMPPHLSLTNILKTNGYRTAFYYGGNAVFDNMNTLLRRQGIDRINDQASFGKQYRKMPGNESFTWGYGDKELVRNFFDLNAASAGPSLQVLLTLSTHDPFLTNETGQYLRRFEKRMNELGLSEPEKQTHRAYRMPYASVLYLDDALKNFFAAYRQRPDFQNTIFLITGDHRLPEIPMLSKIDRYHVPLIIYSPLLRQPARFRSVSTHFDIAPSLLAYLRENYQLRTPSQVAWMGTGLDTARGFRNVHAYPIMMTKTEMIDYVMGNYLLNNNDLYEIGDGMKLTAVSDPDQARRLSAAFGAFKRRNQRFIGGAPLVPDSVLRAYAN